MVKDIFPTSILMYYISLYFLTRRKCTSFLSEITEMKVPENHRLVKKEGVVVTKQNNSPYRVCMGKNKIEKIPR